ncbi:unnamed protein product [Mytilus coruscus]|uniref:Uncharacterized protein n=1 Tax=Mytilus coruscus TaxID=42192 RepID=A0A6J8EZ28_MYTCO|nr:unnamed protein product [Mytilus coruscus]
MHTKCLERGLKIDKESVRLIIKCLDPTGVKCRNARQLTRRTYMNPNYIWHMDGYDKLKHYGICPICGCPRCITADLGTENGIVRELQVALRDCDGHETNAFLYGTSKCNQRIESWWNILRKESAQFWMDMFQTIKDDGHFSGDFLDDELKIVVRTWNSHKLRSMKNVMTPCGRPELLYNLPELCGADNYLYVVKEAEIAVCEQACTKTSIICEQNVFDLCIYEMEENNWTEAACASEGIDLYLLLRPIIRNLVL